MKKYFDVNTKFNLQFLIVEIATIPLIFLATVVSFTKISTDVK